MVHLHLSMHKTGHLFLLYGSFILSGTRYVSIGGRSNLGDSFRTDSSSSLTHCGVRTKRRVSVCRLIRGTIVSRTYDTHKNLNIYLFVLTIRVLGPIYYGPPKCE